MIHRRNVVAGCEIGTSCVHFSDQSQHTYEESISLSHSPQTVLRLSRHYVCKGWPDNLYRNGVGRLIRISYSSNPSKAIAHVKCLHLGEILIERGNCSNTQFNRSVVKGVLSRCARGVTAIFLCVVGLDAACVSVRPMSHKSSISNYRSLSGHYLELVRSAWRCVVCRLHQE